MNEVKSHSILIILIILLGSLLRIVGINFGLPDLLHADEPIVVNHAMAYGSGDFNPHFFYIPPLISYLLFFFYGVSFLAGSLIGKFQSTDDFALFFLRDPTYFYILGRVICGVIFGTLSVIVLYNLAKRLFSESVALLSALFLSVCFLHVQQSHYIYVDVPMVFFVLMTCIFAAKIIENHNWVNYLLAGCFAGIAAAAKYNAALVFAVIPAVFFTSRDRGGLKILLSFAAMVLTFIILNPYSLLDFSFFWQSIISQSTKTSSFVEMPGFNRHMLLHHFFYYSIPQGVGILSSALSLVGMLYFGVKDWRRHLPFLVFPFLLLILLAKSQSFERYVLPILPFVILYASAFIILRIKNKMLFIFVVLTAIGLNLGKSAYSNILFTKKDTRTLSREWIEKNIPPGSKIAIEHSTFCPRLKQTDGQIRQKLLTVEGVKKKRLETELRLRKEGLITYNVYYLTRDLSEEASLFSLEKPRLPFSIGELKGRDIEYVVFHIDSELNLDKDFYQELLKNAKLLIEFRPYRDKNKKFAVEPVVQTAGPYYSDELFSRTRNGYIIQIFKLR